MFAVIKTGGKQYRVAANDKITVMSLPGVAGEAITFDEVLMLDGGAGARIGTPFVSGAAVQGTIIDQTRGPKVIAFKKRRRKNSKRKRGHRQDLTLVRITGIMADGQVLGAAAETVHSGEPSAITTPAEHAPVTEQSGVAEHAPA